jgi:hypothetical protein
MCFGAIFSLNGRNINSNLNYLLITLVKEGKKLFTGSALKVIPHSCDLLSQWIDVPHYRSFLLGKMPFANSIIVQTFPVIRYKVLSLEMHQKGSIS